MIWKRLLVLLVLFSSTYKVLLEASIPTGLRFAFVEYGISILYGSYEVVDIFSDEYLQYQCPSLLQEHIRDIQDSKVEFNRPILIHACLTGRMGSDIGSDAIELYDIMSFQELYDGLCDKYIPLK